MIKLALMLAAAPAAAATPHAVFVVGEAEHRSEWSAPALVDEAPGDGRQELRPDTGRPWIDMDYGPFLSAAIEVTPDNIANKGLAIRVGDDASMLFDTDLLRYAAGWPGEVALRGIVYDGPHGIWPTIDGEADWTNPVAPGVSTDGTFVDEREHGFGPVAPTVGRWGGVHLDDDGVVLEYRVRGVTVRERPGLHEHDGLRAYVREIECNGRGSLVLQVCRTQGDDPRVAVVPPGAGALEIADGTARVRVDVGRRGPTRFKVLIAPLRDRGDAGRFDRLVRSCPPPRPVPPSAGHAALWRDRPVLAGELDALFERNDVVKVITRSAGDPADAFELDLDADVESARTEVVDGVLVVEPAAGRSPAPLAGWDCDEGAGAAMRNLVDGAADLALDGVTWRRGVATGRSLDFDGTARARWTRGDDLEWLDTDLTVAAWVHTTRDGAIFSQTEPEGPWGPDGKTLFIRDGVLCYDVGWVGVVTGETPIADGRWHHVAFSWDHEEHEIVLYVDGRFEADGVLPPRERVEDHVIRFGFTASNFPQSPWFSGYMDGLRIFDRRLDGEAIRLVAAQSGVPIVTALGVRGALPGARWRVADGRVALDVPATDADRHAEIAMWHGPRSRLDDFVDGLSGASARRPFVVDRISWPDDNPYRSWLRFGDFDFLDGADGPATAAVITTWSGDVWRVDGLDDDLEELTWQRIATGLSQPLGVEIVGDDILVVGRDQITKLVDRDGDGETDVYANYNHDTMNTEHFHEPCSGLEEGADGSLYYLKAARHALNARHPMHGTLVRVLPNGAGSEILASGFRAPNGLHADANGVFWGSDQEGHWMPANRINRIVAGGFYGNNWSGTGTPRDEHDPPLCWIHPTVDRSPSAQLRVPEGMWGDLGGALLGLSYGTGEVYRILEDEVEGVHQGGVAKLPIELPTGLMNGHFNPRDGHLYVCGLFGWSSDKTDPGGFYRVRRSDTPHPMPVHVRAVRDGLVVRFNEPVAARPDTDAFRVEAWNYRWSEQYGSPQLDLDSGRPGRTRLPIRGVAMSPDRRVLWLDIPTMRTAMQVHVQYELPFEATGAVDSYLHLTVHRLAPRSGRELLTP